MLNSTTYYYLMRISDRKIFYVGKTTMPVKIRLSNHITQSKKRAFAKDIFIQDNIGDICIMPFETVLHKGKGWDIGYREKYWIQEFQRLGHILLNNTLEWMGKHNFKDRNFNTSFFDPQDIEEACIISAKINI